MRPYATNIATFSMMLDGFGAAVDRFEAGVAVDEPAAAFVALFEALNWAVALDDRCGKLWAPEGKGLGSAWRDRAPGAELLDGVRWVRNIVHHQWSDALVLTAGMQSALISPMHSTDWVWRPAAQFPETDRPSPRGLAAYGRWLEGRRARQTLAALRGTFTFVGDRVEPKLAPNRAVPAATA